MFRITFSAGYYNDATRDVPNKELFQYLKDDVALQTPVAHSVFTARTNNDPNWFNTIPDIEKLYTAYDMDASYFIGTLLQDGNLTLINDAVSGVFTMTGPSGDPKVDWLTYMKTVEMTLRVTNGPLSETYTSPRVTLTAPDYVLKDTFYLGEHHLCGSSRLGIKKYPVGYLATTYDATVEPALLDDRIGRLKPWYHWAHDNLVDSGKLIPFAGNTNQLFRNKRFDFFRDLGWKHYEIKDHLNNINLTILDKKTGFDNGLNGEYIYLCANISSYTDYYPFGMPMPGRNASYSNYRMGLMDMN